MRRVTEAMLRLLSSGGRGVLATVVRAVGSTPQQPGARLLLLPDGATEGTVGGGAIEQAVLAEMQLCLRDGRPRTVSRDLGRDLGMCCGGRMEVFVEPVESSPRLVLFGAGHVGKPTAHMARMVGFEVTVVDDREELNSEERFPGCARVLAEPREAVPDLGLGPADWVVIATHDHALDEDALELCASGPHRYVGMIGSKRKVLRVLSRIRARGPLPPLERVYTPVGLDLGAVSPEEIAVSIVAELVALRHGQSGSHMRALDDPQVSSLLAGSGTDAERDV